MMTATETEITETVEAPLPWVFEIREENFAELAEKFEKMVKRARKCNLPAPAFEVIWEADEQKFKSGVDGLGERIKIEYWVHYLYVVVAGERPTLAGWDFVATIEHAEEGNLIKSVPGAGEIPTTYRKSLPVCEHCNTARRRQETFVIRKADGSETRQIGRNCLQDFFPGLSPSEVATQLEWWYEAGELLESCGDGDDFMGGGRQPSCFGIESLLQTTQACIDAFGWVSRTKAKDAWGPKATADFVILPYLPPSRLSTQDKEDLEKIQEHYDAEKNLPMIQAALEWVRAIDPETAADFLYNLNLVCKGETVRDNRLGLACSLLPAYRRFLEGEQEKKEAAANPSEYVGEVGKRNLFAACHLTYMSEPYPTDFGTSTRLTFKQGSNVLIWWSSNPDGFEVGQIYDLVATPKAHEPYFNERKGITTKQTVISRTKIATEKDVKKYTRKKK